MTGNEHKGAEKRLQEMAAMTTVDPTPLDAYGRCSATFGDLRQALTELATKDAELSALRGEVERLKAAAEPVAWRYRQRRPDADWRYTDSEALATGWTYIERWEVQPLAALTHQEKDAQDVR